MRSPGVGNLCVVERPVQLRAGHDASLRKSYFATYGLSGKVGNFMKKPGPAGSGGPLNVGPWWLLVHPTSAKVLRPRTCCSVSAFASPLAYLSYALFGVISVRS
jgi:hypothetical protein